MNKKCKNCKTPLIELNSKNGTYLLCYKCKTRYINIKNKLIQINERFQLCPHDPEMDTWAVDDTLTDGKYINRISQEEVINQLNELDNYSLELLKENIELRIDIASLHDTIESLQEELFHRLEDTTE